MSKPELLPCPFCGEEPSYRKFEDEDIWSHNLVWWVEVSCMECCTNFSLPEHAIEPGGDDDPVTRWNTRV